jgi:hypothetical protein
MRRTRRTAPLPRGVIKKCEAILRLFSFFDYLAFLIGAIGTLLVFGASIIMSRVIVALLLVLPGIICCFSILLPVFDRFVPRFDPRERRVHVYHVLTNIIPTIYVLNHLKETPWEFFNS